MDVLGRIGAVGLVANLSKAEAPRVVRETSEWLLARGVGVVVHEELGPLAPGGVRRMSTEEMGRACDVILSIGGDGTLIAAARAVAESQTPILGVNLGGKLGFLTELGASEMPEALGPLLQGGLPVERRMNLSVRVRRGDTVVLDDLALNDCALNRGSVAGILDFSIHVGDEYLGSFWADGVVVSTPTGSTAYSLSAGGPILHPLVRALVVTPICPHALSLRPVVLDEDQEITLSVASAEAEVHLTVDGHAGFSLIPGDHVIVTRSPFTTRLVSSRRMSFYARLRRKFEWADWRRHGPLEPGIPGAAGTEESPR